MICWRTVNCFRPHRRTVDAGLVWHYGTHRSWLDLTLEAGSATMTSSGHARQGGITPPRVGIYGLAAASFARTPVGITGRGSWAECGLSRFQVCEAKALPRKIG